MKKIVLCVAALLALSVPALAKPKAHGLAHADAEFYKIVDTYFDDYFKFAPSQGTADGFHQYDDQLEDYSKTAVEAEVKSCKDYLAKLAKIPHASLSKTAVADYEMLTSYLKGTILGLETIRWWEKNPDYYGNGVSGSIFVIMSRDYAPAEERLRHVIAREKLMSQVFVAARENLKNPPKIYTEIALEQLPGTIDFFKNDVPAAFTSVKDDKLQDEFKAANQGVIDELRKYEQWMKDDLLPRSKGDFRIGADNFRKKLLYEEMVDMPLEQILKVGIENMRQNQKWLKETAAKIDPNRSTDDVFKDVVKMHPDSDRLLESFRNQLGGLKDFLTDHKIVTVPSPVLPIVEETPSFERALTFASMDVPGPYETKAKEAYFNVTLPEPDWSKDKITEHMEAFNWGTITSTAVHEAYPGHYLQFLWIQNIKSKVRKLIGCNTNIEGWAHYTEQMMLDQGYGGGDLKLRLGQLQDALLRNARLVVGIQMHTGKMTYNEGIDYFVKEGYQSHTNAEREVKRGTSDPTYLYYTLGKLEILKLREDYKKLRGTKFSLQEFHDEFMKQGGAPIKLIRRAMLGKEGKIL